MQPIIIPDGSVIVFQRDLVGLNEHGRPCELDDKPMKDHKWVILDLNGFVVGACSETMEESKNA